MSRIRIKKEWLLFVANPILSLAYCLRGLFDRRVSCFYAASASLALVYMYMPILWDVKHNFYRVLVRPEDGLNAYTWPFYVASNYLGVSFYGWLFVSTCLLFLVWVFLFKEQLADWAALGLRWEYFVALALVFTLFEYRVSVDLQRTSLAVAFFVCGLASASKRCFVLWLLLAVMFHPFVLIGVFVWLLLMIAPFLASRLVFFGLVVSLPLFKSWVFYLVGLSESYIPPVALNYLLSEAPRFSSEVVAGLVLFLRVLSVVTIYFGLDRFSRLGGDAPISRRMSRDMFWLKALCFSSLLLSLSDVFMERLYFITAAVAVYMILSYRVRGAVLLFVSLPIFVNSIAHGLYTLVVVFSDSYSSVVSGGDKLDAFFRLFYLPTPVLLQFGIFGQSDRFIFDGAPEL